MRMACVHKKNKYEKPLTVQQSIMMGDYWIMTNAYNTEPSS